MQQNSIKQDLQVMQVCFYPQPNLSNQIQHTYISQLNNNLHAIKKAFISPSPQWLIPSGIFTCCFLIWCYCASTNQNATSNWYLKNYDSWLFGLPSVAVVAWLAFLNSLCWFLRTTGLESGGLWHIYIYSLWLACRLWNFSVAVRSFNIVLEAVQVRSLLDTQLKLDT